MGGLTANFQVHVLAVLAYGVPGSTEVLAGIVELHVLYGQRGDPCVAPYHNVSVQAL